MIWGDFDVDGQTSVSLLVSALQGLGARVSYHVPHREHEGHGVYLPKFQELLKNDVNLVITCDTGIAAHESIDYANSQGVDVVITDHHQLPSELPNAYAKINPQRVPDDHPLHALPGVGAAYKLIEALYERSNRADETRPIFWIWSHWESWQMLPVKLMIRDIYCNLGLMSCDILSGLACKSCINWRILYRQKLVPRR